LVLLFGNQSKENIENLANSLDIESMLENLQSIYNHVIADKENKVY